MTISADSQPKVIVAKHRCRQASSWQCLLTTEYSSNKEMMMKNQSLAQSPDVPAIVHPRHLGGPVVPLPLRRVETFELDDQDCAEETYDHWCSLPTFLEAKMYLCPISEIITVTAFFAQTLPPGTVFGLRKGYFQLGDYLFFGDESVVLAQKQKQNKRLRKKTRAKSQSSAIKQFGGRLEVLF